ncbi:MAG: major facilitator transporter [Caulobacteraceae bacterium]|nr:major facilitator transporter [Caulobacteraceae bacterium]
MDSRGEGFRQVLDSTRVPRALYWVLGLIALLLVTDGYGTQSIGFVAPVLIKVWGVKKAALTPVIALGLVGVMIGACGATPLADKIGARRILIACAVLYGVLMTATVLVTDISGLILMRILTGVALGGAMPTGIALVSEYSPTRLRATLVTVAVCGFSLGGALGGAVASLAIGHFGWQSVFFIGGVAPLLLTPLLFLSLPESLPLVLAGKASARAMAMVRGLAPGWTPAVSAAYESRATVPGNPVLGLFADGLAGPTLLIWVLFFMNLMVLYTLSSWLPTIMTGAGLPLATANFATSFYQLGGAFGGLLIAFLCDRFSSRYVLPITFIGASISCFLIGSAGVNPTLIVTAISAAGFCVVGGQSAANAFVGNYYPSQVRASGIGWALGIGRLGTILGSYVIGALIAGGVEAHTLFEICAIPGLFAALAIWLVARNKPSGARVAPVGVEPVNVKA